MSTRLSTNVMCRALACALLLLGALPVIAGASQAKPFLHPLFADNMVMQREAPVPVWGWATPGSKVAVSMNGKSASAVADASGKWMAKLGPFRAGGPYTLAVQGPQTIEVKNVMVGDVWICSGQSNMEMGIGGVKNADTEIAQGNYPNIRIFKVPNRLALSPQETADGNWQICTPDTLRRENYTAVGYFFGRALNNDLKVPIGLIQSAWGGTVAEAWTSAEALTTIDDFRQPISDFSKWVSDPNHPTREQRMQAWWKENDPGIAGSTSWADPAYDASAWKTMKMPQSWETGGLADFDGIVWFRKVIDVPADWANRAMVLHLGAIDDMDTTWVNGVKVGETSQWNLPRNYNLPEGVLKPGRNVIAVRVLDTGGPGGMTGTPEQLSLQLAGSEDQSKILLAGDWQYQAGIPLAQAKSLPAQQYDDNPNNVTVLYNGMIAPLVPFAIKGAIWYQGESNADRAMQYRTLLPTMIQDWRSRFGVGQFPFLIVQLAGFTDPVPDPVQSGWAELREAQLLTTERDPKCGLALAIDIGEAKDIHPKNKQEVGRRLALAAEGIAYGRKIEYSGPIYKKMAVEGKSIRLYFDHIGGGLVAKDGDKLRGFAIAGADKLFVWADARIDGKTVVVSAASVSSPAAVRYDWANLPDGNLYNKAGLPASPFRTDVD